MFKREPRAHFIVTITSMLYLILVLSLLLERTQP
jgi:hypothetical protein